MLTALRNNAIHFYNQQDLSIIIYGLAQTSIINYKDLMLSIFGIDITNEMTVSLLPLSFGTYPDPIEFLQRAKSDPPRNKAVAQFLRRLSQATKELEEQSFDTSRFLTVFTVKLNSVRKVSSADIVVGVKGLADNEEPLIIEKRVDPNISHTLRRKDILAEVGNELNGIKFTSHTFDAIVWKYEIKEKKYLCWHSDVGGLTKYSAEVLTLLKKVSRDEIEIALNEYREYCKQRRKPHKSGKTS